MKKSKKIAVGILIAIGLLAVSLLILNNYLEKRIKTGLEESLKNINATYDKVDVKLLNRKAEVINPYFKIEDKTLKVDTIEVNNIQIWEFITNKNVIVGNLSISQPVVKFYNLPGRKADTSSKKKSSFKNKILIKKVKVTGGSFQIFEKDSSQHRLYTKLRAVKMEMVRISSRTLDNAVPFDYDLILLNADSVFYDLDRQHELAAGKFKIDNNEVQVKDFRILPKFSKSGHQKTISVEKDRYDLQIDSISMSHFRWSKHNDTLNIQNPFTLISGANFSIYRDKLQPDDTSIKPMYSQMIRNLPVKLQLDSVQVENAYIRYEENIHADRETGVVDFSNLNAKIANITNMGLEREDFPRTTIDVTADFMKVAPLQVNWDFNINNINDRFQISGDMGRLGAEQMNKFLKPAMNVEANGEIVNMFFTFSGNDIKATGDMRLQYNDFKVEVLRKDGKRKNKIISALANLIVKNNAMDEKAEYKDISYTRDRTKSFWNYLWNLIKNGALKAFL